MTIRELIISFGYEIDPKAEKKVNDSIDKLKTTASDALGATDVGFEVDKKSKKIAFDSIEEFEAAAKVLKDNSVGYEVDRTSEQQAKNSISRIRSFAFKMLGAIGIGFSLAAIRGLSEEFGSINDQIRDATRGMGDQHEIQQRIKRAANEARQDYATMANTINRLAQTNAFADIEDAAQFATLIAQDFAAAGKSQEKAAYLTRYITMDLQKGSVSSRTITTMFRDAPHMVNRLADSLGVTTYALQDMARSGELSAQALQDVFFDSAEDINARFSEVDMTVTDALRNVRNNWGLFVAQMNSTLGISRTVARGIVTGFNHVLFVLRRAIDMFTRVADRVGGLRNLMRLLAATAGTIFAAMKANVILGFLQKVRAGLLKINKQMLLAKLKVLAIVAVAILLFLLIDDFLAFMRGDNSLLGEMLEKFGVDAEGVREIILGLWETVKGVIPILQELALQFGALLVDALRMLLPLLMSLLQQILPILFSFISQLLPLLFSVIETIIPLLIALISQLLPIIFQIIEAILPVLISLIESLLPIVFRIIEEILPIVISLIEMLISAIFPIIEAILPLLMSLLEALMPVIIFVADLLGTVLAAAFEGLMPIIDSVIQIFGGLIDFITGVFTGNWSQAWEGIKSIFSGIVSALGGIFKVPINFIIEIINHFIGGLNRLQIPDWVPGVGGMGIDIPKIPMLAKGSDFSPDTFIAGEEGPELITNAKGSKVFTAAETIDVFSKLQALNEWEPGLVSQNGYSTPLSKLDTGSDSIVQILQKIANLLSAPSDEDVGAYYSNVTNNNVTVNQDIYNEFHGDRAGQERSAEAMEMAADDATGELARALAYVR